MQRRPRAPGAPESFQELQASVLYCQRCRAPQPVRERMLLYRPDGELHEYRCAACAAVLGSRKVTAPAPILTLP
jgi:hypothetical protein